MRGTEVLVAEPEQAGIQLTDDALFVRYLAERQTADFEALVHRYQQLAFRIAFGLSGNQTLAEDATQEAFLQLTRPNLSFKPQKNDAFRSWFICLTMNVTRALMKNERRGVRFAAGIRAHEESRAMEQAMQSGPAAGPEAREERSHLVLQALESLGEELRLPLILHFLENTPQADIGRALGVTQAQVSRRISKGLDLLRKRLAAAGVNASLAALPSLLNEPGLLQVPPALQASLHGLPASGLSASLALSQRMLVTSGAGTARAKLLWPALAFLGASAAGLALYTFAPAAPAPLPVPAQTPVTAVAPASASPAAAFECDFNSPQQAAEPTFQVTTGAWRWEPRVGRGGSGAMKFDAPQFAVALHAPLPEMPLRVTYYQRMASADTSGTYVGVAGWTQFEWLGLFYNVGVPHQYGSTQEWIKIEVYYTTQSEDTWVNGKRTNVAVVKRKPGGTVKLFFGGHQFIDDLRVESVRPEDCPDVTPYIQALRGIEPVGDARPITLPGLPSARPGKPVYVRLFVHGITPASTETSPDAPGVQP